MKGNVSNISRTYATWIAGAVAILACLAYGSGRAQEAQKKTPPTPGPMLQDGFLELQSPAFNIRLVRSSQTVAAL
ncbi:MAG TPA: hypothetical protein VF146_01850, partial [Bryobacteraceae bacterium]